MTRPRPDGDRPAGKESLAVGGYTGLYSLLPLIYIGSLVVSIVIATAVWRLVRAHESISMTLMEMVEELRKKNRAE